MNPALHSFFGWLLRASAQAAIITLLILLAQICLRKHLDARWRHLLWLLVLVRLAMPISLPSPTSLFNFVPLEPAVANTAAPHELREPSLAMPAITTLKSEPATIPITEPAIISASPSPTQPLQPSRPPATDWTMPSWPVVLALIWALGVAVLGLRVTIQNILFTRRLHRGRVFDDPQISKVLQDCKSLMGLRTAVVIVETDAVKSPALYGLFTPRLLMPPGLIDGFSKTELRHVLLHELAHVRRCDMLVQWLVMLFQILHWFNPILWFGFRRMAVDRELACDDLALSVVGESGGRAYGQTIIKLLEACSQPPALPALVGILEDKAQMFQRIAMIARFKQRSRWSFVGIIAAIVLALGTLTGAQTKPSTEKIGAVLTGTVQLTNGQPADATVFIYTAGPKGGTSPLCPSCYPDCRNSAKTDKHGRFKIESLDPQLLFRLLVVGKNCQPAFVADVDPLKGPTHIKLQLQDFAHIPRDQAIRGRIVDSKGAPIRFASIVGRMVVFRDGTSGGPDRGIDPLAVSNERGEFVLPARRPLATLTLVVDAPGYAKRTFPGVVADKTENFRLTEGAMVKGRITLNGEPIPNVSVGITSEDRSIDNFAGAYEVGTDTNGTFLFVNLPPNTRYQVCGLSKLLHTQGATKTSTITAGDDGTVTQAGDLAVEPAYRISGQVALADGQPVPTKTQLSLGRGGWDTRSIDLAPDGSFSFDGVPAEVVRLTLRIPGYHLSVKNESFDSLNPFRLVGRVNQDISGLVILMEKGKRPESYLDGTANGMVLPENRPLAGAEHYDSHARERMISGSVTDKETGQPVASFAITPGRPTGSGGINWNPQRVMNGTNGTFAVYVPKDQGSAALMIEAAGYLPMASPELPAYRTNFDFAISKGSGPSGLVLLPDGKPATGASVALMRPMEQSKEVQLSGRGKFQAFRHSELVVNGDSNGHFACQPALGMNAVAACSPAGFKMVSLDSLTTNQQITLEPWGKVKGTIRRGGHPSAREKLYLSFSGPFKDENLDLFSITVTDEKGNFEFDFAPPVDCQIYAETPTEDMPARLSTEKEFQVKPGQTTNLTIDAAEKPVVDLARARQRMSRYSEVPSRSLQGVVLLPNGKAAADTQVGIADEQHQLQIGDGELVAGPMNPNMARTDQNGAFTVPWPSGGTKLFVANEDGVASLNIGVVTNGIQIVQQPWARVEGTLRMNHAAAGSVRVRLHQIDDAPGWAGFHVDATTDSDGHFLVAHVLPGTCGFGRWVDIGHGAQSTSDAMQFDLAPGESTNIVCGGDGRPVKGTLDLTFGKDVPADAYFEVTIHNAYPRPLGMPGDKHVWTAAEMLEWRRSPAGKLAQAAYHAYIGPVSSDRTFQVDDVLPGNYEISINGRSSGSESFRTMIEGVPAVTNITIPPLANPEQCEPYDLGHIQVTTTVRSWVSHNSATNTLKVGDVAPAIATKTHDGKPLHLSDYRGKFVLLDLRFMLPGREMDGLQSVNDAFAKDDRFVIISLSQQIDDDFVKQITNKSFNHWIVGDLDFSALSAAYGLDGSVLPFIALVGPDGKIMASQLTGDSIYAAVAQALGKK